MTDRRKGKEDLERENNFLSCGVDNSIFVSVEISSTWPIGHAVPLTPSEGAQVSLRLAVGA